MSGSGLVPFAQGRGRKVLSVVLSSCRFPTWSCRFPTWRERESCRFPTWMGVVRCRRKESSLTFFFLSNIYKFPRTSPTKVHLPSTCPPGNPISLCTMSIVKLIYPGKMISVPQPATGRLLPHPSRSTIHSVPTPGIDRHSPSRAVRSKSVDSGHDYVDAGFP